MAGPPAGVNYVGASSLCSHPPVAGVVRLDGQGDVRLLHLGHVVGPQLAELQDRLQLARSSATRSPSGPALYAPVSTALIPYSLAEFSPRIFRLAASVSSG